MASRKFFCARRASPSSSICSIDKSGDGETLWGATCDGEGCVCCADTERVLANSVTLMSRRLKRFMDVSRLTAAGLTPSFWPQVSWPYYYLPYRPWNQINDSKSPSFFWIDPARIPVAGAHHFH